MLVIAAGVMPAATNPAGMWEGTLKTPNGDIGMVINLHLDGNKWGAELDVPMQGLTGLPLKEPKVDGAAVSVAMPGPGDPHYDGKLSDDGKSITGNFIAGGQPIPMDWKWKSEPRAVEKTPPNSGEVKVLEGVWEGVLDANGTKLHLRFNFVKNSEGNITGTLDSLDQGANDLPVGAISRTGDVVKVDLKAINGSYQGTLNKEATGMTGTFTQNGNDLPLALERKKAESKN